MLYVDVTFGGFLGLGAHHHTIPWEKLTYDTGYRGTEPTSPPNKSEGLPAFYGEDEIWPDRKREQELLDYWRNLPRGAGLNRGRASLIGGAQEGGSHESQ